MNTVRFLLLAGAIISFVGVAGCPITPVPTPPPPTPTDGPATCRDACARLLILHCPAGEPTPEGASCEKVCENHQKQTETLGLSWDLNCVTMAMSCAIADDC